MSFEQLTIDLTTSDLDTLNDDVLRWLDDRIDLTSDRGKPFASNHSQLVALRTWFSGLLAALRGRLAGSPSLDLIRQHRRSVLGLYSLWDTLQRRLQQREGLAAAIFACADDVAFCCHEPTMFGAPKRRPPLPFLSYDSDPRMFPSGPIPDVFARAIGPQALGIFLKTWPLTMVHLPVSCRWAPWWLVILGHEVGHQVQFELDLVGPFAESLRAAAEAAGRPEDERAAWSRWGVEIFADTYSVLMMGRAAIRALFELVHDRPAVMQQRHPLYPPAVIRLELMRRLADALHLPPDITLPVDLEPIIGGHEHTRSDRKTLDAIVPVLTGPLNDLPMKGTTSTLAALCHHDETNEWSDVRAIVQESFIEYAGTTPLDAPAVKKLADSTLARIRSVAPVGLRGPAAAAAITEPQAADLADSLLTVEWSPS